MDAAPHPELLHTLVALAAISIASLVGSISFALGRRLQAVLPYLVAIASGTLLGTAVTHLLPEAIEHLGSVRKACLLLLLGLVGSFLLERFLSLMFRHLNATPAMTDVGDRHVLFHHSHEHEARSGRPLIANILLSGAIHSFVDGVAIAVVFAVSHHAGIATTVAVFYTKFLTILLTSAYFIYSGMGCRKATLLNLLAKLQDAPSEACWC